MFFFSISLIRGEGDNGGKKGKGHPGTCIKDPWTKAKGIGLAGGRWGGWGRGEWWGKMETAVLEKL